MSWILLLIAGLLEVAWAAGLKTSEGFTRLWPSVFTVVTALGSFVLLAMAMRQLPLGTAYAVWTGIGAVGAFVFGIVMMGEALDRRAGRQRGADRDRTDRVEAVVRALSPALHAAAGRIRRVRRCPAGAPSGSPFVRRSAFCELTWL